MEQDFGFFLVLSRKNNTKNQWLECLSMFSSIPQISHHNVQRFLQHSVVFRHNTESTPQLIVSRHVLLVIKYHISFFYNSFHLFTSIRSLYQLLLDFH